jgi:PAS domain S-box-containing protein
MPALTIAIRRLRTLTIILPLVFLLGVEALSIFVLLPALGNQAVLRLLIIFTLLTAGAAPFSFWVFSTIERHQQELVERATVLDTVQDFAIFTVDPDGFIATWNPGAERVLGYPASQIIGRHIERFYPAEDVTARKPQLILERAAEVGRYEDEGWRVRRDGSLFWANVVTAAIFDEANQLAGYTQVSRDMSERRDTEERIRSLNWELHERVAQLRTAYDEIERRNEQLRAVNEAIGRMSSALNLHDVLENIVHTARTLVNSRYAALGVADEQGRITEFITSGITPAERAAIGPLPQGHGLLGALIHDRSPLRIPNIAADPRSHGFPPNHPPMTSLLGVPILYKEEPVGDLYFTDKFGADEFSEEDQDLVLLLANHAAVAIENARLYEEVRDSRDRLQVWNQELEGKVAERTQEIQRYSKEMTTRVLNAQEEERKRIARELHDDTAQSLSTLMINLDLLEPSIPADNVKLRQGFDRVRAIAQRTLDAVRALSHDLRPTILDDFGLAAALYWFAEEYTKTFGVPVEVDVEDMPEEGLSPELELTLFRVAQEALTNSGKYAGASEARVSLAFPESQARLVVSDDGRGFNPETVASPTRHGGLGLYGMRERVELIGGQLAIQSAPGEGTRVEVDAPVSGTGHTGTMTESEGAEAC